MTRPLRSSAIAVLALVALAALGEASTVLRFSNEELARRADVILHGKCTGLAARAGEGPIIITDYTFEVTTFVKGAPADGATKTFTFSALGGTLEGRGYAISGSPVYAKGEEVVLFLDAPHPKTGCRHAIGLAQGKFTAKEEAETKKKYLVRDLGGLRLVDRTGHVVDVKGEGPRLYLEPFLEEVRAVLKKK